MMAAAKKAPWPTECPFINDVIALVLVLVEG
jgi:hypothetical protein